tara:strand:- start:24462 stop:24803 length:342 start_codon:yes stop_codon:yes gene_type:complete
MADHDDRPFSIYDVDGQFLVGPPLESNLLAGLSKNIDNSSLTTLMVVNLGREVVYLRTGYADVVADKTAMPVLPGERVAFESGQGHANPPPTHIAFYYEKGQLNCWACLGAGI